MRDDMVDDAGGGQVVSALALGAERVAGQKQPPFREPPGRAIERADDWQNGRCSSPATRSAPSASAETT